SLVVQCKHYQRYDELLRALKKSEISKVKALSPSRYILTVSTPLTPLRKDEIFNLLVPHCISPGDIFGREDLNNLLGVHPMIERKHIKLWLTSEVVLSKIIQGAVWADTDLTLERVRRRTS